MTDERDRRPGGDVEVESVQDVREVGVAEVDVLEADVAPDRRQLARVRRVHDLRLLVEDDDDPVERGRGREERVVELRELLDGVEEVPEVEREREERPDGEAAVDDERAAEAEDDRGRDRREHVDGGEVDAVEDDRLVVRASVRLVHAAERRLARGLAREGLDDPHARDVLGERRGDEPEPLPHAPVRAVRADPEPRRRAGHQRQDDERREREPPVEEEEDDGRPQQEERVLHEARDAVGHELVERLDVVRDPADDRAGSVALVEAEREALEVAEEPDAQVGERPLAHPAGEVRLEGRERERRDPGRDERDDDDDERLEIAIVDAVVDRDLREVRREERDERVPDERDDRERRARRDTAARAPRGSRAAVASAATTSPRPARPADR